MKTLTKKLSPKENKTTVKLEYHKGQTCVVDKKTFCQEGYCAGCELREIICEQCGQRESKCVCKAK
jgi:hypothetical protein